MDRWDGSRTAQEPCFLVSSRTDRHGPDPIRQKSTPGQHHTTQHNTMQDKTTPHHTTPHHTTPHHTTPHHTTPHHTTPHHTTPHHTTPHHTTPHPEYSPALLTGWVPGAKPPTTGPGHHPNGWCTNSVGCTRAPAPSTTPKGARGPLVPAARAPGTDQRSLERTAGTASPSISPQRLCPTHRALCPNSIPHTPMQLSAPPPRSSLSPPRCRPCARPSAPSLQARHASLPSAPPFSIPHLCRRETSRGRE